MPRPGGDADKLGNYYEATWTVDAVIDVFLGKATSITVEAFGGESEGVEFHLETPDKKIQFHSVKRQKRGGDWSVVDLCRAHASPGRSILGDLFNKCRAYNNAQLRFVSATGVNQLRELIERAETPTTLDEFRKAISGAQNLQAAFADRMIPLCSGDEEFAFRSLQALEVVLTDLPKGAHSTC